MSIGPWIFLLLWQAYWLLGSFVMAFVDRSIDELEDDDDDRTSVRIETDPVTCEV